MRRLWLAAVIVLTLAGCGAVRMPPVDPRAAGDMKPQIEDVDAGLVGTAANLDVKKYDVIIVEPFGTGPITAELKDDDDKRLAKDMVAYLQNQVVTKLRTAGVFTTVIDGVAADPPAGAKVLRLSGDFTKLTEGSQAVRYFVGFGAGAAKAQIETRLVDPASGQVVLLTADRRAAGVGIFGGDGRQFVTEGLDQMADGYVKLLKRLAAGGKAGK